MKRFISVLLVIALLVPMLCVDVFAENKTVSDFTGLKDAIAQAEDGDVITVSGDITLTDTIVIESKKNITIKGSGKISADKALTTVETRKNTLFLINNSTVTFNGLTLDGAKKNRVIYSESSKLTLTGAKVINGCPGDKANINPGGGIFLRGGSLTATDTDFIGNTPGTNDKLQQGDGDKNGGAIYVGSVSTDITIEGGSFTKNSVPAYGHGAAIYQNAGKLNINTDTTKNNKTKFTENTGHKSLGDAGTQGVCIHTREEVTADINNVEATIVPGFNTGGFLRSLGGTLTIKNSKFTIAPSKGEIGIAGGVISSQNSKMTIEKSNFKAGDGTRVVEAGGLIEIVGTGKFNLTGSTLEGAGAWWNAGKYTANTGGAISFYDGSTVTANITDTTIKNIMADGNGAGIALSKGNGHKSSVNLTLKNTTIQNAAVYTFGANSYGGCMYIGEGNTVKIEGGTISGQTTSNIAAGIYNMGDLEITGGAKVAGNTAYQMVGGIYHGGSRLKIDEATISGNQKGDNFTGHNHFIEGKEKSGINIYADKDVIITPKATFDDNDVRVFDGQSSILLTGALTNKINVSISEATKTTNSTNANIKVFEESQYRKVGYVVAKGTEGYEPTADDSKKLYYVTNDTNQAVTTDKENPGFGKWDFVLNPETKEIVLGQRAKVTFDPNGTTNAPANLVGKNPEETKDENFVVYSTKAQIPKMEQNPTRKGYRFTGWYKEETAKDNESDPGSKSYQSQSTQNASVTTYSMMPNRAPAASGAKTWVKTLEDITGSQTEITSILNPYEYTLYAGWEKVIPVRKVWVDENNKYKNRETSVTVKLLINGQDSGKTVTLQAKNGDTDTWTGEFTDIPNDDAGTATYTVQENPAQITGYTTGVVTGDDLDGFVVTNSTEFIDIKGSKTWNHGDNPKDKQPKSVTVTLKEDDTVIETKANVNEWEFKKLPKYKKQTLVNYSLTENAVENYASTKSADGYSFTNTYTNKFKVHYVFEAKDTDKSLPKAIDGFKPTDDTEYKDGDSVTVGQPSQTSFEDTVNDGTWTFAGWDKQTDKINKGDVTFTGYWTFKEKKSDFTITKTVDKATYEKAGEELTYTITVTNTGEKDLTKLKLTDQLVNVTDQEFDLTLKEKTKVFTYKYTVTEADVTNESITNTATVTHGKESKEDSKTSTLITKKSEFTITKSVDKTTYKKAGEVLTYTITVTNTGEKKLENLILSDPLMDKGKLIKPTEIKPFDLDVNASQEFKYTYTITDADVRAQSVTNVASVTDGKTTRTDDATSILKEKEKRGDVYVRYETEDGKILDEFAVLIDAPIGTYYYTEEKVFPRYRFVGLAPYSDPAEGYVVEGTQYVVYLYRRDRGGRTPDRRDRYEREEKEVEEPIVEAKRKPELNKKDHKQYMYGYPDWTFVPAANITRGEAAAMFARLFKEYPGLDYNYKKYYTDVDESYWGFKEVAYLSEFGILSGYSDGTFRPNNKITRAEFVKIAESFEALTWGLSPYNDVDGGHWAFRYIVSSAAKGWISGYPDGSFRPNSFISRAEAVTIVNRLLERRPDKDYIDTHKPELKPFTDLKPSYWAYYEIYEAVDGHDYNRSFTDIEEHWYRLNNERFVFSQPRYYR